MSDNCINSRGSLIGLVNGPNTSTNHVSHKHAHSIEAPSNSSKAYINGFHGVVYV